jgi:hypothetical protein
MRRFFHARIRARCAALSRRTDGRVVRTAATWAIVSIRLRNERHLILWTILASALLAYVQRYSDPQAQMAGCLIFGTLFGISASLVQRGAGRFRELELCEQSAPLFGRELARATALAPCAIATSAVCAYWVCTLFFAPVFGQAVALTFVSVNLSTLVALTAGLRHGVARAAALLLACGAGGAAFALSRLPEAAFPLLLAGGFFALRQYGETLARYDPLPGA